MVSVTCTKGFKTSQDGLVPNDNDNCHNVDNNEDRDDNDYVNDEDSDNNDNVDKEDGNDNDNVDDEDYNGRSPSILLSKDEPVSGRTKALVVPFFIFTFLTFTFHSVFHNDFFSDVPPNISVSNQGVGSGLVIYPLLSVLVFDRDVT